MDSIDQKDRYIKSILEKSTKDKQEDTMEIQKLQQKNYELNKKLLEAGNRYVKLDDVGEFTE